MKDLIKTSIISGMLCQLLLLVNGKNVPEGSFVCGEGKFKCNSEKCIPELWQCDGDDDCGDGSDEIQCAPATCRPDIEFTCRNRKCIPSRWACDKETDCSDGSDEDSCPKPTCQPNFLQCNNSRCIPDKWKCDGQDDCGDNSDEIGCSNTQVECKSNEFKCGDKTCIFNQWKCDGEADCEDKSDEVGCTAKKITCGPNEFACNNNRCILSKWRCDGTEDCVDGSDEKNCSAVVTLKPLRTCASSFWQCANGDCIKAEWQCDGDRDCTDNSDETSCDQVKCEPNKFSCKNGKQCIFSNLRCDGEENCDDGSDEKECKPATNVCGAYHFNCTDGTCIEASKVCNGDRDCSDGKDEPVNCFINECANFNGHCMHTCTDLKIGYQCSCKKGYKLSSDKHSCEDINECELYGFCHQLCDNMKGHYKCSCAEGYSMEPNGKSCKAVGTKGWIYFANRHDIRRVSTDGKDYTVAVSNLSGVVSFDFHISKQYLYWSDIVQEKISRTTIGEPNSTVTILKNVHTPDGLAVDWITGTLYWTDTGYKTIEVADSNGKHNMDLVKIGLSEPRAIALNPHKGYVYWTDWGKNAAIERISMDGEPSTRKTVISKNIAWPNGLTLDLAQNRMYWIDAKLKRLEVANLDGNNRFLVKETDFAHPFALDNFEDTLYWSDWKLDGITKMSKFNVTNTRTVTSGLYAPMDVKVMHTSRQKTEKNPCEKNNNGCSHLCLLANHHGHRITVCHCPRNMLLDSTQKTCVGIPVTRGPKVTTRRVTSLSTHPSSGGKISTTKQTTKIQSTIKKFTHKQDTGPTSTVPSKNAISHHQKDNSSSGMSTGAIIAIIVSVVIGIILVMFFLYYIKRRNMNKGHVMYYKDMSTAPLEEDFDIEHEEIDEKAKIISDDLDEC